ncbi:MAG: hypothetical protein A4E56_01772 [Pelotomaculum sp. PtaU1.Bin065]|nr:MAG: hypothetical protein A4E56_01772 [Pelotomaculum sp. PtaU1.Bin065]
MYKNKSKAANEHHDVSEKHDRKKTEEHTLTQKSLHPGFLQTQDNILQLQEQLATRLLCNC